MAGTGLDGLIERANGLGGTTDLHRAGDIGGFANPKGVQQEDRVISYEEAKALGMAGKAMLHATKGMHGGFNGIGDFAKAVRLRSQPHAYDGQTQSRLKGVMNEYESNWLPRYKANSPTGMNETFSGADGGALVPPEFVAQILMRMYNNDILQRCTIFPIGSNAVKIPAINETSRADGSRFGGVSSTWRREGGTLTASKPGMQTIDLSLESLSVLIRPTEELLEDTGGALEVWLNTIAAQEIAFKVGDAIINGDGVGKPKGIMNSAAKITAAAEVGQPTGTIVSKNISEMYRRLHRSCMDNCVWLFDQSIYTQLFQMTVGTAGANMAVFIPPGGLSSAPYGALLGRPMIPTEFNKQVGTEGDLILVDLSQVLAATRGGIQAAVSMHLYFDSNEMAFRYIIRCDAKPWWLQAISPKSGGDSQSFCVTLASR